MSSIIPPGQDPKRVPPGQYLVRKFPVLSYGPTPPFELASWNLQLVGELSQPVTLDYAQFKALSRVEQVSDFHCVTTWSRLDNRWQGVRSSELLKLVELTPRARFVIVWCDGGYSTNLPLAEFLAPDVMLADGLDGHPLERDHGFPARLVVPRLYGWKSAKWVRALEFSPVDQPGFWELRGYHNHGDPWGEERYSDDDEPGSGPPPQP